MTGQGMRAEEAGGSTLRCKKAGWRRKRHSDPGGRLERRAGHRRAILRRRRKLKVEVPVRAGHSGPEAGGGQEAGWQAARKGKRKLAGTLEARHRGLPPLEEKSRCKCESG